MVNVKKKQIHTVATRLSDAVFKMMQKVIATDLHVSGSDFLRDAVKFYIRERWPGIYAEYSGEKVEE